MKSLLPFFSGAIFGICFVWPGIIKPNNWKCFKGIIDKAAEEQISFKAALSLSPRYLLKGKKNNIFSKIRIVGDACFR